MEDARASLSFLFMLHEYPEDAQAAFFDYPSAQRRDELCANRLFERYKDNWRNVRGETSVALSSDNPPISDNGVRALHDGLISSSFGFHPLFGTGHVLRTNGVLALFWVGGQQVEIVELDNVIKIPVLLSGERKPRQSKRAKALASAVLED